MRLNANECEVNLGELTGLEIIQQFAEGTLVVPMVKDFPMRFEHVEKGLINGTAKAEKKHCNAMGVVHGGFAAVLLDSITGCVVHTMLEKGVTFSTIDLNIKMLRPIPVEKQLMFVGKIISVSRNIGVSEATISDDNGKIFAHATATCFIFRPG